MKINDKINLIRDRLQNHFNPTHLEVIDESAQHVGHAGHQGGGRHFAIVISSASFDGFSKVESHRKIYELFSDLIPVEIHALRIKIL